jgi:hypothetical protein
MLTVRITCQWVFQNGGWEMYPVLVYVLGSYTYIADDPNDASRLICECEVSNVVWTAMQLNPLITNKINLGVVNVNV